MKSIYLSVKKSKGLTAFLLGFSLLVFWGTAQTEAAEGERLFVTARNVQGQKLLIRYDAVYTVDGDLKLELPAGTFESGEDYILTLECQNRTDGEKKSRTFYLRGGEP